MGKILDAFKAYAKWATSDFTGNYEIKAYDSTTGEGIQSHLDDFRKKTGVAVGSLETAIDENETKLNSLVDEQEIKDKDNNIWHYKRIGNIITLHPKNSLITITGSTGDTLLTLPVEVETCFFNIVDPVIDGSFKIVGIDFTGNKANIGARHQTGSKLQQVITLQVKN